MRTWYTSDLHIGHVKILDFEPSRYEYLGLGPDATVPEMDEAIIKLWNDQVAPEDTVYVIGDIAMGRIDESMQHVKRLNGRIVLVMGNHDRVHPSRGFNADKHAKMMALYRDSGIDEFILDGAWDFDGIYARVSHFPYEGDNTGEERYPEYRPVDNGGPLVHGHVHGMWDTNGRMYNVGIDAWNGVFRTPKDIGDYFRSIGFES